MKLVAAVSVALAALCFPCVGQVQPNELQEQCRKKTEELFYRTFKRDIRYASFESHYSLRYNKCLYLLRLENKPRGPTSMWLGVLDEKILYFGAYVEHRGTILSCHVIRKYCRSEEEWREMIKLVMED